MNGGPHLSLVSGSLGPSWEDYISRSTNLPPSATWGTPLHAVTGQREDQILRFLSDSKAAIQAICSNTTKKSEKIKDCYNMLVQLQNLNKTIHLQWVPAHCGIEGNELADTLAKKGTTIQQMKKPNLPMTSVKRLINSKFSHLHTEETKMYAENKKWNTLISNPDVIPQAP